MPKPHQSHLLRKDASVAREAAEILKAMAHPLRLQIVSILAEDETHVNAMAKELGMGQAVISQQLRILRMRKLVTSSRRDGFSVYRLNEPHLLTMLNCINGWLQENGGRP